MTQKSLSLFIIPTLIWGTTWYAITFQLDGVHPLVSIVYRFGLAGLLLMGYCRIRRISLKFTTKQHFWIALQGLFLFGLNYWLTYVSEQTLASGLVAMMYATLIFFVMIFNRIFLKVSADSRTILGGVLGLIGTYFLFYDEILTFDLESEDLKAVIICLVSVVFAAVGNVVSQRNQQEQIPIMGSTVWAMLYATLMMAGLALFSGVEFTFNTSWQYISALVYLAIVGSVIAFVYYLRLIAAIGGAKAGYVVLVTPIIAMFISTYFENYQWTLMAIVGSILIIGGNLVALYKKRKPQQA